MARFHFGKKSASFKIGNIRLGTKSSSVKVGGITFSSRGMGIKRSSSGGIISVLKQMDKEAEKARLKVEAMGAEMEIRQIKEIHKDLYEEKNKEMWEEEAKPRKYEINGSNFWEEELQTKKYLSGKEEEQMIQTLLKETEQKYQLIPVGIGLLICVLLAVFMGNIFGPYIIILAGIFSLLGVATGNMMNRNASEERIKKILQKKAEEFDIKEKERLELTKKTLEEKDMERVETIQSLLKGNIETIKKVLDGKFNSIAFPRETLIDYAIISPEIILLDVDLPEIEDMPTETYYQTPTGKTNKKELNKKEIQEIYAACVHSIAVGLASSVYTNIPTCKKVIISGYTQRINKKTGNKEDEYLYSITFEREIFEKLNLINIDPVLAIENFSHKRDMTKTFILKTIEPYSIEDISG